MTVHADDGIRAAVLRALEWDTRIDHREVGVRVKDGIVTLCGTAPSYARKLAAQEVAHGVRGVLDVANEIEVKLAGSLVRTDTEVAAAVRQALEWDALLPDDRIRSTVSGGVVMLEGEVESLRERLDAERVVEPLAGVCGVRNLLVVADRRVAADELRALISDALERRAQRGGEAIRVMVNDGEVTLAGTVDSRAEKRAVLGIVSHAPGVRQVHDAIAIDPYGAGKRS